MVTAMQTRNIGLNITLVMIFIAALLVGLVGGIIGAAFFAKTGPAGPQGVQGVQGVSGLDGTDAILQVIQSQNATEMSLGAAYTLDQWYSMSVADDSMRLTMNVQDQSRIYAEFMSSVYLANVASMHLRIVVDNQINSTICKVGIPTPSAVDVNLPAQVKIVTSALPAGQHTIDVQFLREDGTPLILDRSLVVMELVSP
jgi:hypothetical protein